MKQSNLIIYRRIFTAVFFLMCVGGGFRSFSQTVKTGKTKITTIADVSKTNLPTINVKDFGAKGDGIANDEPAFEAAKKVLTAQGGGVIYFPAGKYLSDNNGWHVYASNITLQGAGIDKTFLLTPDNTNAPGLQMSPYRDAGWANATEQQYTYEDNAKEGDLFIHLKPGQDMSRFVPGTIFYLSAGASYYDQYYGEFNIVKRVERNTLCLQYPLGRDYSANYSAWYGKLIQSFRPPVEGETAVAYIQKPPNKSVISISLGNDLYEIVNVDGNRVTLKNPDKGNLSSIYPSGTKVYKGRSIRITPSTSYNVQVQDMTIEGHRGAIGLSNSVKTRLNRIKFIFHPGTHNDGLWLDGDDGRDCIMQDCIAQSDSIVPSQFARSFSNIKILHCTFLQTSVDFTEFNANCEVAHCTFSIINPDGSNRLPMNSAITVGASTYRTFIHDNTIHIYRRVAAIAAQPDIQTFPRNHLYKTLVMHNTIVAEKCFSAISIIALGDTRIDSNIIRGSVSSIFGGTGSSLYVDSTLSGNEMHQFMAKSTCKITNNKFTGRTDGFFFRDANNVFIEGNTINRTGDYTSGGDAKMLQGGNIVFGNSSFKALPFYGFVLRNNTFTGWNYNGHSINFNKPITKSVDISNNRFINNTGTFKKEKDFTISINK